jgi:predicted enzyme related to lactoylglutathione lyase
MGQISILGLDNVLFAVGDLATARAFYEGHLGLKVKFAAPEHGIVGYALGNEEPGLVVRQEALSDSRPRATPKVWLEVRDARAAAAILASAGVVALANPFEIPTGWTVEIADPWGNVVGLTDYVKAPTMARRTSAS